MYQVIYKFPCLVHYLKINTVFVDECQLLRMASVWPLADISFLSSYRYGFYYGEKNSVSI